jgi:two-component system, NarL family, response regulator NreC
MDPWEQAARAGRDGRAAYDRPVARPGTAERGPTGEQAILSPREREILRLIALKHCNQEIAALLSLSVKTVENKLTSIMGKLAVHDRAAAVIWAYQNWVVPGAGSGPSQRGLDP